MEKGVIKVYSMPLHVFSQCVEVYATCSPEADGKYADAMGTDPRCQGALPHYRSYHICK